MAPVADRVTVAVSVSVAGGVTVVEEAVRAVAVGAAPNGTVVAVDVDAT